MFYSLKHFSLYHVHFSLYIYIHYKLMKLNFTIWSVLSLSSWWQQLLGRIYGLQCQNGLMVTDLFAFRKTKSCRQQALLALRLPLATETQTSLTFKGGRVGDSYILKLDSRKLDLQNKISVEQ